MEQKVYAKLIDELDRIEPNIDPYVDPDLLEQWVHCISLFASEISLKESQKQNPYDSVLAGSSLSEQIEKSSGKWPKRKQKSNLNNVARDYCNQTKQSH